MHLQTHLVLSWLTGCRIRQRRDRILIAWSGVAPDLDGLTVLAGIEAYGRWHHTLTHGLVAAIGMSLLVATLATDFRRVFAFAFAAFHLHLMCDLLGSGREWPIAYLYPFSTHEFFSPVGWGLTGWQNIAITAAALAACGFTAVRFGRSFLEACLPRRFDVAVVEALRLRFASTSSTPD
jgi:inner membrane protein